MEIFIGIFALIFLGIIIGITFNIAWLAFGLVAYFVPTIIAAYRKHPQTSLDIFDKSFLRLERCRVDNSAIVGV